MAETSLHRDLKRLYAPDEERTEVRLGRYRIDAVTPDETLVEIQHGSLSAIRRKIRALLEEHRVKVVKPLVVGKQLVKLRRKNGRVVDRRRSPKRGRLLDVFDELVYFTDVFPHRRLTLEVVLVEVEEWRYPGHGRRRWRRPGDFQVADQRLVEVRETRRLRTAADLRRLVPADRLPSPFHTGHLADVLEVDRWVAQRIAYCFRKMGTARNVGKEANALLYEFPRTRRRRSRRSAA